AILANDRTSHGYVLLKSKNQTTTLRVDNDSIRAVSSGIIRMQGGTDITLQAADLVTVRGNQLSLSIGGATGNSGQIPIAQGDGTAQWDDLLIDSTQIANGGVSVLDLGQHGATSGQVLKWNGTQWTPAADTDTGDDWGSQAVETDATLV